jgi:cbb3-type cytochrome oxidase maturation protein
MDSLYILLPLSVLLVLALIGVFAWAIHADQFDDLEREAWRVLEDSEPVAQLPRAAETGRSQQRPGPDPADPKIPLSR